MMRCPPRKLRRSPLALFAASVVLAMALSLSGTQVAAERAALTRQSNDQKNRTVRIHNQTGWPIIHLYASSGSRWTGDLLPAGVLLPGRSVLVVVDDGSGACSYSLRAEFENGQSRQRDGVNACEISDDYFTR